MFESPYIKVDEHGIDLVKNYQVDKHIEYREINSIHFKKGHLIKNWILSLILSLFLTGFSLIWGIKSVIAVDIHSIPSSHVRMYIASQLFIPWFLFVCGAIWLYLSTKSGPVLSVNTDTKDHEVGLIEFQKNNTLNELIDFLADRVELKRLY
jgi:hypothetical protein